MKHWHQQLLALTLALLLCLSLLPTAALAEEPEGSIAPVEESGQIGETEDVIQIIDSGQCGDSVNWRLTENGALVIYGSGDMWDYTVQNAPKWVIDHWWQIARIVVMEGVTGIGDRAFCTTQPYPQQIKPEEILLPKGLYSIGNYAFDRCVFENLTLPEGLQEIGEGAFRSCQITGELRIPGTVQRIGNNAFQKCESLENLVLEEGVQEICEQAFAFCKSLKEVHIPASVTAIGYRAFGVGLNSLTDVYYGGSMADWERITAEEAVMLNLTTVHCADGDILPRAADACGEDLTWSLDENGVLRISGTGDMWDYGVTNPTWYDVRDQIREIEIMPGVTGIGDLAFDCRNLERVSIPEGLTRIGRCAFSGCRSLEEILLPESLEQIGDTAFYNSGLICVAIPEGVTVIGGSAFGSCSKLTYVSIPGSVGCISSSMFNSCKALSAVNIGEGVETIEYGAFGLCESLNSLRLPSTLRKVGEAPFYSCRSLEQVFFTGPAPSFEEQSFYGVEATVFYPAGDSSWTEALRQDYGGTITWVPYDAASFGTCGDDLRWILEEDGTLILFGTGAMWDGQPWQAYAQQIRRVILPEGLSVIRENAFAGCEALTGVKIPASMQQVKDNAFSGCTALERVDYGSSQADWTAVRIESGNEPLEQAKLYYTASGTCGNAVTWTLSDGVLELRGAGELWAFSSDNRPGWYEDRTVIDRVEIENRITKIGTYTFSDCEALTDIIVDEENTAYRSVDGVLFSKNRAKLLAYPASRADRTYSIPKGTTSIDEGAFCGCYTLESVTLPSSVADIGAYAFNGCKALRDIHVDAENTMYQSIDGVLFTKSGTRLIAYPSGKPETTYTIPEGITSIFKGSFYGCSALESVVIPEGVKGIGIMAFKDCTGLSRVTIPASVTELWTMAFAQCTALQTIVFQGSAPANASEVFSGVTATAYYPAGDDSWTEAVRQACGGTISWRIPGTGDVNRDRVLNGLDLLQMRKYLVGEQMTVDPLDGDLNGDGPVTILDLVRLRKLLVGLAD